MKEVIRQEQKYLCNLEQALRLKSQLSKVIAEDPNNHSSGYKVRSLYFDTLVDSDFYEKGDGIENRKKVRLRIYHPNDEIAFLEIKQKQGKYQRKRSLKVSRQDALSLCKGDYSVLLYYKEDFAKECYVLMNEQLYRPKVIIEYQRFAYQLDMNETRITLDSNLYSTSSSFNLFDENLVMNEFFDQSGLILEVKFNDYLLSYVKELIQLENASLLSISKYYLGRQHLIL